MSFGRCHDGVRGAGHIELAALLLVGARRQIERGPGAPGAESATGVSGSSVGDGSGVKGRRWEKRVRWTPRAPHAAKRRE